MAFVYHRTYAGPLKAAIFDWAGTVIDYGCMAPAATFIEVFKKGGVVPTMEQARQPMGLHKRDHIEAMAQMPAIAAAWTERHGAPPSGADIDAMFDEFIPMQMEAIKRHADVIPGAVSTAKALRERGMKLAGTTGYNRAMMTLCMEYAAAAGYEPDASVCAEEVPAGRPAPWMALRAAELLGVYPLQAYVKIGDTPADIGEGLNAGMWTVGVVRHGNEVGLSQAELDNLGEHMRQRLFSNAENKLRMSGAHYIAQTVADVPAIADDINARLARGEQP